MKPPLSEKPKRSTLHRRNWSGLLACVLVCGIGASLLYLNNRFNAQIDLSATSRHSLSQHSVTALAALPEPVQVTAVLGPDRHQREAVTKLFDRYKQHKPQLTLEFVNLETEPARVRELKAAAGGELIINTDGREQRLQNLSERSVTAALTRLSRTTERHIAFVTGHAERTTQASTNADFSHLAERLQSVGLAINEISLVTQPRVPEDIDLLVIAAPQHKYFPGEVASLIDYIGRGGNLLWLHDEPEQHGLEALALELGVSALTGVVIDATSQAYGADSPTFAVIDQFPEHAVNQSLANPILLPGSKALAITPLAGQSVLPLLQTREQSWTETGAIAGAVKFDPDTLERRGPLVLAAAIERESKNRPDRSQRIVVIGDADWLASQWIGNGANLEYAERLFNWLAADNELLAFDTASPRDGKIDASSRSVLMLGGGFLVLLPLLLTVVASVLWHRLKRG